MSWNIMTALMDSDEWGPIPDDGWMAPGKDTTPPPPPLPFAAKAKVLHEVSHKDDDVIDTPEIQGEEE